MREPCADQQGGKTRAGLKPVEPAHVVRLATVEAECIAKQPEHHGAQGEVAGAPDLLPAHHTEQVGAFPTVDVEHGNAERMGTSQSLIARLEAGRTMPSTRTLLKIAAATSTRPRFTLEVA